MVSGLGQAAAGRPAHSVLQTLGHMEAHEGLLPCLCEYQAWGSKGPRATHFCGARRSEKQNAGWEAEAWVRPMEEHRFSLVVGPIWSLMNKCGLKGICVSYRSKASSSPGFEQGDKQ